MYLSVSLPDVLSHRKINEFLRSFGCLQIVYIIRLITGLYFKPFNYGDELKSRNILLNTRCYI